MDRSAVYAVPIAAASDALLLGRWLEGLYHARAVRGVSHYLRADEEGVSLVLVIEHPDVATRALLDVAFSGVLRPVVLARLWALPGCCAGLAQDLDRSAPDVQAALDGLAAASLVYEHRGIWRARPLQRGGEA